MQKKHAAAMAAAVVTAAGATIATIPVSATVPNTGASAHPAAPAQSQPQAAPRPAQASPTLTLSQARAKLRRARTALLKAQDHAADLDKKANRAESTTQQAHRDLGNLARDAYAGGPADLMDIATLVTSEDPSLALRDASRVAQYADGQADEWREAAEVLRLTNAQRAKATAAVTAAEEELREAQRAVIDAQGGSGASGPGAVRLAQRCGATDSVSPICIAPRWTERNLTLDATLISRYVSARWPQVRDVGGWRPGDPYPDHPSGRAVDIMMPNGGGGSDVALGNQVAAYFQKHADEYGIYYMIWRQRMWKSSSPVGAWSGMSDRGSPTANHMDHVHISVTDGRSATIVAKLLKSMDLPQ